MEPSVRRNFSLKARHIRIIEKRVERESLGDRGFSIALRKILDEWDRMDEIAQKLNDPTPKK